jgi:hypothetical protein
MEHIVNLYWDDEANVWYSRNSPPLPHAQKTGRIRIRPIVRPPES